MIPNKTALISLRTTERRKAVYAEQAEMEGLRISDWLRRLADRRIAEAASAELVVQAAQTANAA